MQTPLFPQIIRFCSNKRLGHASAATTALSLNKPTVKCFKEMFETQKLPWSYIKLKIPPGVGVVSSSDSLYDPAVLSALLCDPQSLLLLCLSVLVQPQRGADKPG